MKTIILADAEDKIAAKNVETFRVKLTNTINVCIGNLEGQQVYIDNWRHLAKSGLLTVPD